MVSISIQQPIEQSLIMANEHELTNEFKAGFRLLTKFQDQWEQIHSNSKRNITKTKRAFTKLVSIENSCDRRLNELDKLTESHRSLAKLDQQIEVLEGDLKTLECYFVRIESALITLKDQKERIEANDALMAIGADLQRQVNQRRFLSGARKESLKLEHLNRVAVLEEKQQKELEDRRRLLGEAFEEEKSHYLDKSKGHR